MNSALTGDLPHPLQSTRSTSGSESTLLARLQLRGRPLPAKSGHLPHVKGTGLSADYSLPSWESQVQTEHPASDEGEEPQAQER